MGEECPDGFGGRRPVWVSVGAAGDAARPGMTEVLNLDEFVHQRAVSVEPLAARVVQTAIGAGVLASVWCGRVVYAGQWIGEMVGVHRLRQDVS